MSTQADKPLGRDWDRLMADAQAGDANAYRILLSELVVWLRRYYAGRLPPAMTEDAVKNVLLAIHEKRHTYDPRRSFGPWLAAIARYKWIDCLRLLESNAAEPVRENPGIPDHGDGVVSHSTSQQVLAEPKPPQAEALRLAKREIRNVAEASRATGRLISLTKPNVLSVIKRLADIIKADGDVV